MNLDRVRLRDDLLTVFTGEELAAVAKRLGFSYAELGGRMQADKAGSLIGQLDRHGRLPELILELVRERPHLLSPYQPFLPGGGRSAAEPDWLAKWAAGEGEIIEEPPTLRWDGE